MPLPLLQGCASKKRSLCFVPSRGSVSAPHVSDWDPIRPSARQESKHPDHGSVLVQGKFGDDNLWRAYPRSDAAPVAKSNAEPRFRLLFSLLFQTGLAIPRKTRESRT